MMDAQDKSIQLTNHFIEITGARREELCAKFSEAIEWGRNDEKKSVKKHFDNFWRTLFEDTSNEHTIKLSDVKPRRFKVK